MKLHIQMPCQSCSRQGDCYCRRYRFLKGRDSSKPVTLQSNRLRYHICLSSSIFPNSVSIGSRTACHFHEAPPEFLALHAYSNSPIKLERFKLYFEEGFSTQGLSPGMQMPSCILLVEETASEALSERPLNSLLISSASLSFFTRCKVLLILISWMYKDTS